MVIRILIATFIGIQTMHQALLISLHTLSQLILITLWGCEYYPLFFLVRRCWILRESKSQQQVWVQAEIQTQAADSKTYIPSHSNILPCMEWNRNLSNLESLCSRSKIVFSNTFSQIHPDFYYPILSSCVSLVIFLTLTIRL